MKVDQVYEVVKLTGDTDPLKEHPQNPRRGVVEAIAESIDVNGWYGAIVAQKSTGYILAGNHRYRAAVAAGAKTVPVIWMDIDDEAALRILLADNRTADLGHYDEAVLAGILESLPTLGGTGYSPLAAAEAALDAAPAAPVDPDPEGGATGDSVAPDAYTPEYGVMIECSSEKQQRMTYEWLQEQLPNRKLRVVAV